ncbi:MAG: cupredoxin domain-containing protein [Betaproteobacteria bacterium]|nr:cupredoxin domain-containing protein [Betaproteobacteria bacterium]
MRQAARLWIAAGAALAMAGCQGGFFARSGDAAYVKDSDQIVKAADWSKMTPVTVELYDYGYTPRDLKLKANQPYRITLKNNGSKDHYYTAPEFYKAVATRKAMVNKYAEIKAPYFSAIEVLKNGGSIDLYVVPVAKGTYKVWCQIDDHEEKGSVGSITVE